MKQLSLWLGLLLNLGLLTAVHYAADDRFAVAAAATSYGFCVWSCLGGLGLRPLSPPLVYLYVLGVFHLGLVVPWAAGVAADPLPWWLLTRRLTPALELVIVATAAFQAGATLARRRSEPVERGWRFGCHNTLMYRCGLALTAVGLASLGWGVYLLGPDRLAEASYFETYRLARTYDPRFFVTSLQVVPMGLYLAAAAGRRQRLRWVAAIGAMWAAGIFLLGFRGFALVPLVTLLAVLDKRGMRLPKAAFAGALMFVLLAIPAVRIEREDPLAKRSLSDLAVASHPLAALQEMGGSLRPLVHTLELLGDEDLRWGSTYVQALGLIAPNLSLEWEGESYIAVENLPPSHWVSKLAAPWSYRNYGGLGFSAIAEPYMNFGTAGVALFFLALGAALVWADGIDAGRPTRLACWAMALGPLLWTTRNTSAVFFRPALWGLLAVGAARLLSEALARRESRSSN